MANVHINVKLDRLYKEQMRLAKKAMLYDAFGKVLYVAGVDCAYLDDRIIGGVVVIDYDTLRPVAEAFSILKLDFPYIPGLLAYREAKAMMSAFRKEKHDIDVLMVDGFGTNHPRRCGIATHIGVKLDMPTIGVGKSFLCGEVSGDDIYQDEEKVGKIIRINGRSKPVYVSPGHRISLTTSVKIVKHCIKTTGIPVPIRLAHNYVTNLKNRMK